MARVTNYVVVYRDAFTFQTTSSLHTEYRLAWAKFVTCCINAKIVDIPVQTDTPIPLRIEHPFYQDQGIELWIIQRDEPELQLDLPFPS